ncbi:uncharacterized protein METZ01_LOCUS122947 [marine metagenome]|uniref:Uncharacterized protein n=1 Tax=marine metagenome TaxID=408172 RepID=A0A381Y0U8_9ZZZZ
MFILIILSYLMVGITTILLFLTGYQGLARTDIFGITHPLLGLLTILIFAFTETFTLTFISAFIKSVKQKLEEDRSSELTQLRRNVYSHGMLSILWITTVFLLGGAVDTNLLPSFFHGMIFLLGFVHYFYLIKLQHSVMVNCLLFMSELNVSEE